MKNTFVKVLSFVMALAMIVGMFGAMTISAAEHTHTKGDKVDTVAPTCQTLGYTSYKCADCGEEWIPDDEVIMPSEEYHNVEEIEAVGATCLTPGYSAGKACTVKGCTYIPEGSTVVETAAQKEHAFKRVEVAATCSEDAKVVYVCTSCNLSAEDIQKKVDKKETQWVSTQKYDDFKETVIAGTATDKDHKNIKWEIVTAPTTCVDGLAKGACDKCDVVKEAVIPAKHKYTVDLNPTGSSCAEYIKGSMKCAECGKISPDAVKNDKRTNHGDLIGSWDENDTFSTTLPTNSLGETLTFAQLYALGFKIGDKLGKEASCKEAGWKLVQCRCGQLYIATIAQEKHALPKEADVAITWPTVCTEPAKKVLECQKGCGYKTEVIVIAAVATAHTLKDTVKAPQCYGTDEEKMGYTTTTCTNKFLVEGKEVQCSHKVVHSYKDSIDHTWGAVTYVSGTCGSATYQQKCTVEKCGATKPADEPEANKKHNYVTTTVDATCLKAAYTTKVCSICKDGEGDETPVTGSKPNPNNHVYIDLVVKGVTQYKAGDAPTCTKEGTVLQVCKNDACGGVATIKEAVAPKAAHDYKVGSRVLKNDKGEIIGVDPNVFAATCKAVGYEANGEFCAVCGDVKKAAKEIAIDPINHVDTNATKIGGVVPATCQSPAKQMWNTTCCGFYTEEIGKKNDTCDYQLVTGKAPTCTEAGYHTHYACKDCKAVKPYSTEVGACGLNCSNHATITNKTANVDPAIAKLGHDWKEQKGYAEKCDTKGQKTYHKCSRCNLVKLDGVEYDLTKKNDKGELAEKAAFEAALVIPAHHNEYKKLMTAVDATCTSTGVAAYKDADAKTLWCTKCDVDAKGNGLWITPVIAHNYLDFEVNPAGADYDCTKDYYAVSICIDCGKLNPEKYNSGYTYTPAANKEHDLPKDWKPTPLKDGEFACKNDTMETKACADCGYVAEQVKVKATGCYDKLNGEKFPIDYSCTKIEKFLGMTCGCCGDVVDVTDTKHNDVTEIKAPTCDKDGYKITYCADCHAEERNHTEKLDKIGGTHNEGILVDYKPATETEAGYRTFVCTKCTAEAKKYDAKAADVVVTVVIDATAKLVTSGAVSADKVVAGTTVTYTVSYSVVAAEITEKTFEIAYDAAKFDFVKVETAIEGAVVYASVAGANKLGVAFIVPNDAEGNAQKITTAVEGTALFTITFAAKKYANGEATFGVAADTDKVTVNGLGNVNGDKIISIEDATAISAKFGSTDANYDINGDGIVDIADLALVAKFAVSKQTAKDYLVMLGTYAEIEATINALYESGKLADCNNDKIVNINDVYVLTAAVDKVLAAYTDYKAINFTSVEALVAQVMAALI